MIDLNKKYKTKSGKNVLGLKYIPVNANGEKVTYPIKGSIIIKEKPLKLRYQAWSIDGIADIIWNKQDQDNLICIS